MYNQPFFIPHSVAEVVVQRSKLFDRMGFQHRGRTYLYIEEAIYLMDRGDLLLVIEMDKTLGRPLTMAEGFELMSDCGVPMSAFRVYGHLRRAGYAVTRYPACWLASGAEELPELRWGVTCRPAPAPAQGAGSKRSKAGNKKVKGGVQDQSSPHNGADRYVGRCYGVVKCCVVPTVCVRPQGWKATKASRWRCTRGRVWEGIVGGCCGRVF